MKLTWFGHSAFRIEIAGAVVMIDPFIAEMKETQRQSCWCPSGAARWKCRG
jgi:L-ascorbate metabolism protein UlaG (beta-lactamase superfamily)